MEGVDEKFDTLPSNNNSEEYVLRLYVSGMSTKSLKAIENITSICEKYLPGNYDLKIIDLSQQPTKALDDQIFAAPTLIKKKPLPERRLIGDLSETYKVLLALSIKIE